MKSFLLLLTCATADAMNVCMCRVASQPPAAAIARARRPQCLELYGAAPSEGTSEARPEELQGPWELKCSVSGMSDTWVELTDEGCTCSSKVGSCVEWSASRESSGKWALSFTLNDKLKRPVVFDGIVGADEVRGTAISGSVTIPPARLGSDASSQQRGKETGKFTGYKLEN